MVSGNEASYFSGVREEVVNMYQQMVLCSILMFSRSLLINNKKTSPFPRQYLTTGTSSRQVNTLVEFVVVD